MKLTSQVNSTSASIDVTLDTKLLVLVLPALDSAAKGMMDIVLDVRK